MHRYLTLSNMKDANLIFDIYMKQLPEIPQTPLINFIRFLLVTLERDAADLFQMLRTKYKASLSRDPSFTQMMDQIGQLYFKLQPSSQSNNFLGELMKSLFTPQ